MTAFEAMLTAIEAANAEAIAELVAETGFNPKARPDRDQFQHIGTIRQTLLHDGAICRIRVMFTGSDGTPYADAILAAESAFPTDPAARDCLTDEVSGTCSDVHEMTVTTLARGAHVALLAPLPLIANIFGLGPLESFPAGNWARGWSSAPFVSDSAALQLLAHAVPVS